MLFPVKFKSPFDNEILLSQLLDTDNDKKASALNEIRIGLVFKTTGVNRYPSSIDYINSLSRHFSNIHDIGCSDGSASISLMKNLSYTNYFGLDLNINVTISKSGNNYFLLDDYGNFQMYENKYLRIYLDPMGLHKSFFEKLISWLYRTIKTPRSEVTNVELVNPECKNIRNVKFKKFDLFNDQLEEKSDLIIIFNLLNKFEDKRDVEMVKDFLLKSLNDNGIALIGENEPHEKATIYQKEEELKIIKTINGGSKIAF